jgi:hypothetical protein
MRPTTLKLCLVTAIAATLSCSSEQKKVEAAVVDVAGAVCQMLDGQDEPGWLKMICRGVETAAGPAKSFILRMPKDKLGLPPCK